MIKDSTTPQVKCYIILLYICIQEIAILKNCMKQTAPQFLIQIYVNVFDQVWSSTFRYAMHCLE